MECPVCGKNDFEKITLMSEEYDDGHWSHELFVEAKLKELPKGDIENTRIKDPRHENWSLQSKVCMGCGYIVMFLPLEKMRRRKAKKEAEAKKKREAMFVARKKSQAETAAKKKAEKEAEKERLKKRLAELEDSE